LACLNQNLQELNFGLITAQRLYIIPDLTLLFYPVELLVTKFSTKAVKCRLIA
jgi:hypothetical protein